ncbi:MAG: DNA polymerase III subunit epsilon [Salinibacterium sp.]|nr:DNA polymerase III subunit epsilon [Salinibacterium sp.]
MRKGYAVFDFETTGLFPERHDRVIEVGLVLLDFDGREQGRFETLVHPGRDLGPTHIHGVIGSDVVNAPRFDEIAASLLDIMSDRILVAHNASFDLRFLAAEMGRCGHELADIASITMCTMQLARQYLPGSARSLSDCCQDFDFEIKRPHHALSDAVATSRLLASLLRQEPHLTVLADRLRRLEIEPWPVAVPISYAACPRPLTATPPEPNRVVQSVSWVPSSSATAEETEFLAVLDRVIADEYITPQESQELLDSAARARVTPQRLHELREMYFASLVTLVWSDGVIEEHEARAIESVGIMLSLDNELMAAALRAPTAVVPQSTSGNAGAELSLSSGDLIVFTGETLRPRSDYEAMAASMGLVVWPSITKKVRAIVAADPTSLSGKAVKARRYGIPTLSIEQFEALMLR